MGLYTYWHNDIQFSALYSHHLPEPSAGIFKEGVEFIDVEAVAYRTPRGQDGIAEEFPITDTKLAFAIVSLEEIFLADDKYRGKREEEAFDELKQRG